MNSTFTAPFQSKLNRGLLIMAALATCLGLSPLAQANPAQDRASAIQLEQNAASFASMILKNQDNTVAKNILDKSQCIATFKNVLNAGFFFGAKRGDGVASCRTAAGWSDPIFIRLIGGSWGFQFGVQKADVMMIFTGNAAQKLVNGFRLQLGGDASVAAGPVGRGGAVTTDPLRGEGVYSYSQTKGVFAGIALTGSGLDPIQKYDVAFYGSNKVLNVTRSVTMAPADLKDYPAVLDMYVK